MKPELKEKYYEDGSIKIQEWRLNGWLYREDGPAFIRYRKDGSVHFQSWCLNGRRHREDGPAVICYNEDGSINWQEWWIDGQKLTKEDFDSLDMIKRMKVYPLFTVKEIARLKLDKPI